MILVKFRKMSLKENVEFINMFYYAPGEDLPFRKYVENYFPELKEIKETFSKEEKDILINETVRKYYIECESKIDNEVKKYSEIWQIYNDSYIDALSKYLNISWPSNIKEINVSVGLLPVYPRFLKTYSFYLGINFDKEFLLGTIAHEILHFLWFSKWKELYPNCSEEEFESPHLIWKYSEMVVDAILNSSEIQGVFDKAFTAKAYDSFYINNLLLMEKLKEIFNEDIKIEDKIKLGYESVINEFKKVK